MASALDVAQAFLDLAKGEGKKLTNMQLQKLVFFAHGIHLGAFGDPLISEPVRAWDFGPVIPELYDVLRCFGRGNVEDPLPGTRKAIDPDSTAMEAVESTWEIYKDRSGWELSEISHLVGSPWDQAWRAGKYSVIDNDLIRQYYQRHVKVQHAD